MLFSAQLGWGKTSHYRLFHLPPPPFSSAALPLPLPEKGWNVSFPFNLNLTENITFLIKT